MLGWDLLCGGLSVRSGEGRRVMSNLTALGP